MYRLLLLGIGLLGIVQYGSTQTVSTAYGETVISDLMLTNALSSGEQTLKYQAIDGSPFQSDEFLPAEIYMLNGFVQRDIYARLDLFEGNVQVEVKRKSLVMSNPQVIEKVVLDDETTYLYFSKFQDKMPDGFYKSYHLGKNKVIALDKVVFKEEEVATNNYSEDKPDRFVRLKERVFLVLENKDAFEVISKKKFLKEMGATNPEIYNYLKKNKLNPTKIDDLVKLAIALDGLALGTAD